MTPRERWVVYPLLFFALSLALKPKLLDQVEAKHVRCESLTIAHGDEPGIKMNVRVRKTRNAAPHVDGGSIQVFGDRGQLAAVIATIDKGKAGSVQVYGEREQLAAIIAAGHDGKSGVIRTYDEGRPRMTLNIGPDDTFVDLHQTGARPANGIIYGVDERGQKLPIALVVPNIQQTMPEDIRRRLLPKRSMQPAGDK